MLQSHYSAHVAQSVQSAGGKSTTLGSLLAHAEGVPTAVWLDEIEAVAKMRAALEQARDYRRGTGVDVLVVFVVYNLPGRDCAARSSAGELAVGELEHLAEVAERELGVAVASSEAGHRKF